MRRTRQLARTKKSERFVSGRAARRKDWAQDAGVGVQARRSGDFAPVVRGDCNDTSATRARRQSMRPVYAVGADVGCKVFVRRDQQFELP